MDITMLFVSQRNPRRAGQIPALIRSIEKGEPIPPLRLTEAEAGTMQVDDGHHRAVAYWLSGRPHLDEEEYELTFTERPRPRFGQIADLIARSVLPPTLRVGSLQETE